MLSSEQNPEECDATDADSSTSARLLVITSHNPPFLLSTVIIYFPLPCIIHFTVTVEGRDIEGYIRKTKVVIRRFGGRMAGKAARN